ncbi:MAG: SH3 domain-containing protein [Anaerolineae bacterium]|nr:SH3 domain-containing protein [Anaerolineae bacterium]
MSDSNDHRLPDENPETRPTLPPSLPEMPDTRTQRPVNPRRAMPPVEYDIPEKPKRGHPAPPRPPRRDNPLHIPLWSVVLMLMGVGGMAACIVGLIVVLGGTPALENPPRILVLTAAFSPDTSSGANLTVLASPTIPPQFSNASSSPLALQGPTLEPVLLSPTPNTVAVGKTVIVEAEDTGLNIRSAPGINNQLLFIAPPRQTFIVIDGPMQADGLSWWKVQNPADSNQVGWAAAAYLTVAPGQ